MNGAGDRLELAQNNLLETKESSAVEFLRSVAYSGIQRPLTAVSQIADRALGTELESSTAVIAAPQEAEFNTSRYWIQQTGMAFGMMASFLVAGKAVTKFTRAGAFEAGLTQNAARKGALGLTLSESFLTGALHDSVLRPTDAGDSRSFIESRVQNGLLGGATMATLTAATIGMKSVGHSLSVEKAAAEGLERSYLSGGRNVAGQLLRSDAFTGMISGAGAGFLTAHGDSYLRTGNLASSTELGHSMYTMAMLGGTFGAWHQLRSSSRENGQGVQLKVSDRPLPPGSPESSASRYAMDSVRRLAADPAAKIEAPALLKNATYITAPGGWYDNLTTAIYKAPKDHTIVVAQENWAREGQNILRSAGRPDVKIVLADGQQPAPQPVLVKPERNRSIDRTPERSKIEVVPVSQPRSLEIASEVATHGKSPESALAKAVKDNQVVAIGEYHVPNSAHRELGAQLMGSLKKAGVTHLAIESSFEGRGKLVVDGQANGRLLEDLLNHHEFRQLLAQADKHGIEIVPVDVAHSANRSMDYRNQFMADRISDILAGSKDAKVVFWVGNAHLVTNPMSGIGPSAVSLLRGKGVSVSTFYGQHDNFFREEPVRNSFTPPAPTAVPMKDSPVLREHTWIHPGEAGANHHKFGEFDWILMYPKQRNYDWD